MSLTESVEVHDAAEVLARALFVAELGHTGMTWEHLGEFGTDEWTLKASRVLEALYDTERPRVVFDLVDGTVEWALSSVVVGVFVAGLVDALKADIAMYGDGRATAGDDIGSYVDGYEQGARDALERSGRA